MTCMRLAILLRQAAGPLCHFSLTLGTRRVQVRPRYSCETFSSNRETLSHLIVRQIGSTLSLPETYVCGAQGLGGNLSRVGHKHTQPSCPSPKLQPALKSAGYRNAA